MTRWEYHVEYGNPRLTSSDLTRLGADGWELVAVTPRGGDCLIYHLKRPLQEAG